ncbi:MAG TPA: RHS repeat domain-containing protein [Emticicia sp.]
MKKLVYSILILFAIACKTVKTEPETPVAKVCQIQKLTTYDGRSYTYKFDANSRLTEILYNYMNDGKPEELSVKFTYNTAGNLLKVINSEGYVDDYIYDASGVLTKIDFKESDGKLYDQFTIKMDAQKRISSMITQRYGLTASYEYNGPGGLFSKEIVSYDGKVLDVYEIKSHETDKSKKYFDLAVKGHLFDPTLFTDDMIYSNPLNFSPSNLMINTVQASTYYDENWENIVSTSRLYWDASLTRKYNENNHVIQEESQDKVENEKYSYLYTYSNCN